VRRHRRIIQTRALAAGQGSASERGADRGIALRHPVGRLAECARRRDTGSQCRQRRMEHLWSPWSEPVAIGGKSDGPQDGSDKRKPLPMGCDRLPESFHGKEGVYGSSPSEGLGDRIARAGTASAYRARPPRLQRLPGRHVAPPDGRLRSRARRRRRRRLRCRRACGVRWSASRRPRNSGGRSRPASSAWPGRTA
jgi:hypothetical protein